MTVRVLLCCNDTFAKMCLLIGTVSQVNNVAHGHFVSLMLSMIYLLSLVTSTNIKEPGPGSPYTVSEVTITSWTMVS